jgi:hypothetical protein
MDGLSRAGQTHFAPRGFLAQAWLHALARNSRGSISAREDLDNAWEIAERGPMRLFLADIHLHRARLFGKRKGERVRKKYPWESPRTDLVEARRLIEKHRYGRRNDELADAEKTLL